MTAPIITLLPIEELKPYLNNAKLHPEEHVAQMAASIEQFRFINPIIIDQNKEIIAGHGRFEAAKKLGLKTVPTLQVDHLSPEEVKAYRLADNQLTLNSGYNYDLLRIELTELSNMELEFDLEITGFHTAELDFILDASAADEAENGDDPVDELPETPTEGRVAPGDLWQLGQHLLYCGDALSSVSYIALFAEEKAQVIITDPPYNVPIDGHVCGNGKIKHREFVQASGEMSDAQFLAFLESFMKQCVAYSVDGSLHYIFMDWRHIVAVVTAGKGLYSELKNICIWNKDNGGMGALYRSKHEMIAVFKHGQKPHINNIKLGKHGRYRTNVWDYKGVNSFGKQQEDLKLHPTVKPVALLIDAIKDCTRRHQLVLDPFAGSGSTLIACEKAQRKARCIELDPIYCEVILQRWEAHTGQTAVLLKKEMAHG